MKKTILLGLFLAFPSFSMPIGMDVISGGQEATCRLTYYTKDGNFDNSCTGTLITSSIILTAAHCNMDAKDQVIVAECGQKKEGKTKLQVTSYEKFVTDPEFKEIRKNANAITPSSSDPRNPARDVSIVKISPEITSIKPVVFAENYLELFFDSSKFQETHTIYRPKPDVECHAEGYGVDDNFEFGNLKQLPILGALLGGESSVLMRTGDDMRVYSPEERNAIDRQYANFLRRKDLSTIMPLLKALNKRKARAVMVGDSGGPVYCKKKTEKTWKIVGVNSQGNIATQGDVVMFDSVMHLLNKKEIDELTHLD